MEIEEATQPLWFNLKNTDKIFLVNQLILDTVKGYREQNPTLWVWSPIGSRDELKQLWHVNIEGKLTDPKLANPEHPDHRFAFPEFKEDPSVQFPSLYTPRVKHTVALRKYFHNLLQYASSETTTAVENYESLLPNDPHDALLALYFTSEVVVPAFLKRLRELGAVVDPDKLEKVATEFQVAEPSIK